MRAVTLLWTGMCVAFLGGCQSSGTGWAGLGWNRSPPYSRSSATPPAGAYAGPQLPSSQATPQTLQGNPYAQTNAAANAGAYPQGGYGTYPGQPTGFDANAYDPGAASPYRPSGESYAAPYTAGPVGPQQGYYDSTYPPTATSGAAQPARATQSWGHQQNWSGQASWAEQAASSADGRNPAPGAPLPGEDAYAGAYAPGGNRTADARAATAPGSSRYDMGSRYNTGPSYADSTGAWPTTSGSAAATATAAKLGGAASPSSSAGSDAGNASTVASSPRRGTAWDDSPSSSLAPSRQASAWGDEPGFNAAASSLGGGQAGTAARDQAGTLAEPWQPGNNGYEPGNNGYQPSNSDRYRSPATAYQTPAMGRDPHYRPGGTGDYEPAAVADRRATMARRPARISPAELEQDARPSTAPASGYPRTSVPDDDRAMPPGSYPRR